jgi:fatty-acyl-CoA synthase
MIAAILNLPGAREADWSRLRLISYGSAPMSPALLTEVMDLAGCDFLNCFGAGTEAGSQTTLGPGDHKRALAGATHLLGSIGKPAFGVELRLCDVEGNDVPRGEVGEIVTRSTTVMHGYLDMPEETERVFIGDGWFRGGDLAYMDEDGYLFLKGRNKDMIIRGGENIYPVEIEHVLAEEPRIEYSAVVGVEDEHWGQTVRAWVQLVPGAQVSADELRERCLRNLAKYKVPDEFVFVEDLPRNASGKVLKRTLVTWEPEEHGR